MGKHFLKAVMAVTLIGAAAYCLKRFSDELVVYVSPDDAPANKDSWTDF
ncbi:hypothetical protein [Lacticaseibacillus paracasei]|nr:hypothetical protein LCA32G_1484 [Lacticaseibacillus paracasei]